jgi:hypothetical protein
VHLVSSRADVVWERDTDGLIVLDEVKAGASRNGHTAFKDQALRHVRGAVEQWGERVGGVRLLWLAAPQASQFYGLRSKRAVSLDQTGFVRLDGKSR